MRLLEKKITFKNSQGKKIVGIVHIPNKKKKWPAVIISSGFKGTKEQDILLILSRNLSVKGFVALRFDYSNWGESAGNYSSMTISQQIRDFESAIEYLKKQKYVDKDRIGIAGVSLGGGEALIVAAKKSKEVKALVAFSPSVDFTKFIRKNFGKPGQIAQWKKRGYTDYYYAGRDEHYRFNVRFYYDAMKVVIAEYIKDIKCPVLITQGTKDSSASVKGNYSTFKKLKVPKKYIRIKGGDHQYRQIKALESAITEATKWFKKYL